ncbi:MAG: thiamine pyrophosphate-dependent dehydrogenase E1 component subunit alpha [Firmicutes bacterium]|nr:thiamine pyrophosphate-dependent dehydrogenase E1 component subunit alpha [Alicyclobacillaceae bacterium]MCL6496068.1 thiamine pyrophosphate-dependent dehydrogenase E1 component subunit alpha [Bacillota bacterium]
MERVHELLGRMLFMRRFEERVIELFEQEQFEGHYHVYNGQEATALGAMDAVPRDDYMYTTHRNHGHLLARGADPVALMAEILGKANGLVGGRGGSYHAAWPEGNVPVTSALVAGNIPQAAGTALAAKRRGTGQVVVCWFGDGAVEEGAFYETMNLSALWKLPVLYLCENNSVPARYRAMGQYPSSTHAAPALTEVVRPFGIESHAVDGTDYDAVHDLVRQLMERLHRGEGPFFIEARTSRWPGSYGVWPQLTGGRFQIGWVFDPASAPEVVREWTTESDPIVLLARRALERGAIDRQGLEALDREQSTAVDRVVEAALAAPDPRPEDTFRHVLR